MVMGKYFRAVPRTVIILYTSNCEDFTILTDPVLFYLSLYVRRHNIQYFNYIVNV